MLRKIYSISRVQVCRVLSSTRHNIYASLVTSCNGYLAYQMKTHRMILVACWTLLIAILDETSSELLGSAAATNPHDDGHMQHLFEQQHPSSLVDTKYWLQDTEFGKQENWFNHKKPCTLLERVEVVEEAVVSLGDSLDAIDGRLRSVDIREFTLPMNGVLLFEEDSNINDPVDPNYMKYLSNSYECWENKEQSDEDDQVFRFLPESDSMSWFNPDNWASALLSDVEHLIPDSHRVPCTQDIVVFGDRRYDLVTLETSEQSKIMSFKVNFRPSSLLEKNVTSLDDVSHMRIARLIIGDNVYNQTEFEQLYEVYGDTLFEIHNNRSILARGPTQTQSTLMIDESSLQLSLDEDHPHGRCNDEAGCLCGNESVDKLEAICSFNEPLKDEDLPCHDPIASSGYCNKICATVLTFSIDPTKFSEGFLTSLTNDKLSGVSSISQESFGASVVSVTRRVQDTRYEITFIHVSPDAEQYESSFHAGVEREFADLIFDKLNSAATKSFYGIRSMSLRSSKDWKVGNKNGLFWSSFILISILILIMDSYGKDSGRSWPVFSELNHLLEHGLESRIVSSTLVRGGVEGSNMSDTGNDSSSNENSAEIALVDFDDRSNITEDEAKLILKAD